MKHSDDVFHQSSQCVHNRPRNEMSQWQWWRLCMRPTTWTSFYLTWLLLLMSVYSTNSKYPWASNTAPFLRETSQSPRRLLITLTSSTVKEVKCHPHWDRQYSAIAFLPSLPYVSASTTISTLTDYPRQYCGIPYSIATSQDIYITGKKVSWSQFS